MASLVAEGLLHPHPGERIPPEITHLYSHQERAIRAIAEGRTTLGSTGTGSGKTECFLYPIVSRCLALRDEGVSPGISAIIVLSDECARRGSAHAATRGAGGHGDPIRDLRRQDPSPLCRHDRDIGSPWNDCRAWR